MPEALRFGEGWIWLGSSILLAILWSNLRWVLRQPQPGRFGETVARIAAWPFAPWLDQLVRFAYYIGLPFAALVYGHNAVQAGVLGLQPFEWPHRDVGNASIVAENWADWVRDIGWALALGTACWGALALAVWARRRALGQEGTHTTSPAPAASGWVLLREAIYQEVHWAFYRNLPIVALGSRYWGTWAGLALVALEATLNPAWRTRLSDPDESVTGLIGVACAWMSSMLFLETANLWLAILTHFGVSLGMGMLLRTLHPPVESPPRPASLHPPA